VIRRDVRCADERNGDEFKQTHVQDHRSLVACRLLLRAGCRLFSGRRGGTGQEDAWRDPGENGRRHFAARLSNVQNLSVPSCSTRNTEPNFIMATIKGDEICSRY